MAVRSVAALKFVGSISLGLLTGISYTVSTLTLQHPRSTGPSSALPAAHAALLAQHEAALSALSATSLLLAFSFSPRGASHPYLLWTTLLVALSSLPTLLASLPSSSTSSSTSGSSNSAEATLSAPTRPASAAPPRAEKAPVSAAGRAKARATPPRGLDASYDVLGDSHSEGASETELDAGGSAGGPARAAASPRAAPAARAGREDGSGAVRVLRTGLAMGAFAMSVVGLWGDGL